MSNPSLQWALNYERRAQWGENRPQAHRPQVDADDVTITPSQAEGDRETIERDLGDPGDDNFGRSGAGAGGGQGQRQPIPSQAEGDREEIERDLRDKNSGGHV